MYLFVHVLRAWTGPPSMSLTHVHPLVVEPFPPGVLDVHRGTYINLCSFVAHLRPTKQSLSILPK